MEEWYGFFPSLTEAECLDNVLFSENIFSQKEHLYGFFFSMNCKNMDIQEGFLKKCFFSQIEHS